MRIIPLTLGQVTVVDDDAPAWIFEVKWHAQRTHSKASSFYAARTLPGSRKRQWLHRVIAGTPLGKLTLHIDGDGLNNSSNNVKVGTDKDNMRGARKAHKNNTSGFRGVTWNRYEKKFKAQVKSQGEQIFAGYFDVAEEAAHARDAKARELGFPEEGMNFPQ